MILLLASLICFCTGHPLLGCLFLLLYLLA